jgi:hypothetical protein
MKYLEQYVKKVILIGIQPKTMSGVITEKVKEKADVLIKLIKDKKIEDLAVLK